MMAATITNTNTVESNGAVVVATSSGDNDASLKNGPIVHVRADSDVDLENLFLVVKEGAVVKAPHQVPFSMRKLPASFFNPPISGSRSPGQHSRDNSVDNTALHEQVNSSSNQSSSNVASPQSANQQQQPPFHSRAHSSPATLQQTMVIAQQQQQQAQLQRHARQPSYDVASFSSTCRGDNLGRLPYGWERATTPHGQVYYMNHIMKTTQWEDPRKTIRQQHQHQQMMPFNTPSQQCTSPAVQLPPPNTTSPVISAGTVRLNLGPLPAGWEEGRTEDNKTYYINHTTKCTTWDDPRLTQQQHQQQHQQQMAEARLQMLENEKRMLQQKTQRLEALKQQQQQMAKKQQQQQQQQQQPGTTESMQLAQEMMMRHSIMDSSDTAPPPPPSSDGTFINPAVVAATELHNRQESSDSGVGGMGSNFNLGAIPEDGPIEMDTSDLDIVAIGLGHC